jgi:mobilome CxxCx(11)CxxC protein
MIGADVAAQIEQRKTDCLAAKGIHTHLIAILKRRNKWADFLALAVPIAYFVVRYLLKETWAHPAIEVLWEISAGVLLLVTLWRVIDRWQERLNEHATLLTENMSLVRQADYLLANFQSASVDSVHQFRQEADRVDAADAVLIGVLPITERQKFYLQAIKEFGGPDRVCGVCHASPWHFQPGSCEACGNTPVTVPTNTTR